MTQGDAEDGPELRRARVGAKGTLLERIDFQVEREFSDTDDPWRDALIDVSLHRGLKVQAGHFKIPVSLDYQTSMVRSIFVYRSLLGAGLTLGRDTGVMAHGTLARGLKYYASAFPAGEEHGAAAAARVTLRLNPVTVGASAAVRRDGERPLDTSASTLTGEEMFPDLLVNGRRFHAGGEIEWRAGDFSGRGELLRVSQQRRGQGTDNEDLADLVTLGWYVTGAWRGIDPLELAARVERVRLHSGPETIPAAVTPRAARIAGEGAAALTVGCNWYVGDFVRLQANSIRTQRERDGTLLRTGRWTHVVRLQLEI
jgi:phosphate-selective porin